MSAVAGAAMTFADLAADGPPTPPPIPVAHHAPTGWEPGVRYDPTTGAPTEVTTEQVERDEQGHPEAWSDLVAHLLPAIPDGFTLRLVEARYDPVAWTRTRPYANETDERKLPATTRPAWRYRFRVVELEKVAGDRQDIAALVKIARGHKAAKNPTLGHGRTRVLVLSDAQIGKMDHRGGTPELLARLDLLFAELDDVIKRERCDDVVIVDPGDLTEGFENTASQMHTNDLSFPEQLDLANAILTEAVSRVSARHASTRVVTVPSNHGRWRKGKDALGRPGDDFGIMTHRTVARAMRDREDIAWLWPDVWEESYAIRARGGAVLGVAHGHQVKSGPDRIPTWWAGQSHGGGPLAAATILITGHFHHLRVQPHGAIDSHQRWWMQAPTLDNGSAWHRNLAGDESEPGLLTFTIDDTGAWDHLRLLTA